MTTATPFRPPVDRPGRGVRLDFFGLGFELGGRDVPDLGFQLGPHVRTGRADLPPVLHLELDRLARTAGGPAGRELVVRRTDGVTVLRRTVRRWGTLPPPVPPFAVLGDRLALLPAVVLAKGGAVVALTGGPRSACSEVGIALAHRSWSFVAGQLLVIDRATGATLPLLSPLELGAGAGVCRDELAEGTWRTRVSPVTGEVLQVRPESLGPVVPVGARLAPATVVQLCGARDDQLRLVSTERCPQVWPAEARACVDGLARRTLLVPAGRAAEEIAQHLDDRFTPAVVDDRRTACRDGRATAPVFPAGSTASARS